MKLEFDIEAKVLDKDTCYQISRLINPSTINNKALLCSLPDDVFDKWLHVKEVYEEGFQLISKDCEYVWHVPFRFIQQCRRIINEES